LVPADTQRTIPNRTPDLDPKEELFSAAAGAHTTTTRSIALKRAYRSPIHVNKKFISAATEILRVVARRQSRHFNGSEMNQVQGQVFHGEKQRNILGLGRVV
jgi:hypothetical protein